MILNHQKAHVNLAFSAMAAVVMVFHFFFFHYMYDANAHQFVMSILLSILFFFLLFLYLIFLLFYICTTDLSPFNIQLGHWLQAEENRLEKMRKTSYGNFIP